MNTPQAEAKQRGLSFAAANPRLGTYGTDASAASLKNARELGVEWVSSPQGGELRVWDDGPGFVGEASRLFAPWYTTKTRGTGLGLAITHRLVRAHGWNVSGARRDSRTVFTVSVRQEDIVRDSTASKGRTGAEAKVA